MPAKVREVTRTRREQTSKNFIEGFIMLQKLASNDSSGYSIRSMLISPESMFMIFPS